MKIRDLQFLLYIVFMFNPIFSQSDSTSVIKVRKTTIDTIPEKTIVFREPMPKFPGGDSALFTFLRKNIVYSDSLKEKEITGTVYCQFTIDKDGKPTSFKILRYPHPLLSAEVLRVMKLMPYWEPATRNGEKVSVSMVIPFRFKKT